MLQIRVVQRPTLEVLVRYKEGFTNEILMKILTLEVLSVKKSFIKWIIYLETPKLNSL